MKNCYHVSINESQVDLFHDYVDRYNITVVATYFIATKNGDNVTQYLLKLSEEDITLFKLSFDVNFCIEYEDTEAQKQMMAFLHNVQRSYTY